MTSALQGWGRLAGAERGLHRDLSVSGCGRQVIRSYQPRQRNISLAFYGDLCHGGGADGSHDFDAAWLVGHGALVAACVDVRLKPCGDDV